MCVYLIMPVVHGHGRGRRLRSCLVVKPCVSCVVSLQHMCMYHLCFSPKATQYRHPHLWLHFATLVAKCNPFFTSLFSQRSSPSCTRDCFQRTTSLSNIISYLVVPKKMPPQCSSAGKNTHQLGSWSPLGTQTGLHTPAPTLKSLVLC